MVANLPPDPPSDVIESAFTLSTEQKLQSMPHRVAMPKLTSLDYKVAEHAILNSIKNVHKWPMTLQHPLYLIRAGSGTKSERTRISKICCSNDPIAIRDQINLRLKENHIIDAADGGSFGYVTSENKSSFSIISYNCKTDEIDWDNLSHFTWYQDQLKKNKSNKSERNKKDYKLKESEMDSGDAKLKELLSRDMYFELSKNRKLHTIAKYKAVSNLYTNDMYLSMFCFSAFVQFLVWFLFFCREFQKKLMHRL